MEADKLITQLVGKTRYNTYLEAVLQMYRKLYKNNREDQQHLSDIWSIYIRLKEYDKRILPIQDFYPVCPPEHWVNVHDQTEALLWRERILSKIRSWPSLWIRNIRSSLRKERHCSLYKSFHETIAEMLAYQGLCQTDFTPELYKRLERIAFSSQYKTLEDVGSYWREAYLDTYAYEPNRFYDYIDLHPEVIVGRQGTELLLRIDSHQELCQYFSNSKWCFARYGSYGMWDEYAPLGHVYILHDEDYTAEDPSRISLILPHDGSVYNYNNEGVGLSGWYYLQAFNLDITPYETYHMEQQNQELELA